ncbi:putative nuclease HARBI1 isoform X1 [Gossypium hirsutum]|uniref:Nuclease HARBI1 isoform X1 n=1 Tax=Gossypium hirsutum TaxID=3635 RepID=A0ABM3C3S2_GOSHI|nr:putative nuclease HARBI1 isoform X1 [Gossypium hirsutum]
MSIVENYHGDESDDDKEKKEILQRMECFNRLFVVASSFVQLYYEKYILKQPCMDSKQTGETWIREVLDGHKSCCMINFRMSKMVFTSLLRVLETRYNLQTSRNISSTEMLGIFLYILGTGAKVSQCRERFQRSGSTISRHFAIVLEKVSRMATDLIAPEDPFFSSIPEQIRNDSRYMPHFKDCIGAIDGTHIAVILPPNEQVPSIGRKGIPTQNVMAVCDFNMCSTFVMAGWEGSAHDTRIFLDAIRDPKYKFPHPPNGKYYLVDSGYPQMKGYLGPYRGQRYHLPDFRRGRPVSGKEKIFNHSHSSLRSVIERTFGF